MISARVKLTKEGTLNKMQENDLLAISLNERDEYFTDQLVKDTAFTFLFAGHETTATGLPGVLMYLSKVKDFSGLNEPIRSQCTLSVTPESIRKP